jgi:hypothetical protein
VSSFRTLSTEESLLPPACLVRPGWVSPLQGLCTARHSFLLPGVKAKKPIQTKFRMPLLNWVALKPSQITGTVFTELNDEKVLQVSGYQGHAGHRLHFTWFIDEDEETQGMCGL